MKNLTIFSLLTVLTLSLNAQVLPEDDRDNFRNNIIQTAKARKRIEANHIKGVKAYSYTNKHPEGIVRYEINYDSHGNVVDNIQHNKRGRLISDYRYQYDDSNRMVSTAVLNKKGKTTWGGFWRYDKSGNMVQNFYWYRDTGTVTYKWTMAYDLKNNPIESKSYSYKGRLDSRSVYEYYNDGSKKKTTTYNRKGKVIAVWNYDCNPIGKLQESKMKDTSKVCVHYETDKNGNPVRVKEDYTQGGWLVKYRLRKITKYDKDNNVIEYITMKMNGKETHHYSADFDAQGNITEARYSIPNTTNLRERLVYTYDNTGNMAQLTVYKNSSKQGAVFKYVYN